MPFLPFPEWLPDRIGIAGATGEIRNAVPIYNGYRSIPSPTGIGVEGAVAGSPNRLQSFINTGGSSFNLLGTSEQIYRLDPSLAQSGTLTAIGRPGGYAGVDHWKWAIWGDDVYGVDFDAPLQKYTLGAGVFDDVAVPNGLTARYMAVVRNDFLMMAHTKDGSGTQRERVRWSGAGLPEDYTPSATTQSSFRDLYGLGEIRGLTGGEFATVLFRDGVVRGDYLGQNPYFQWDEVEGVIGCDIPNTVIRSKGTTYYWSTEGFQAFNGQSALPIGAEKIDRWFADKIVDRTRIWPLSFPSLDAVGWLFVSADSPDQRPDRIIFYQYVLNRWSNARVSAEVMGTAVASTAVILDDLTDPLESLPGSFDDAIYTGSNATQGALWAGPNAGEGLQAFIGPALQGILETEAFQIALGRRGRIGSARLTQIGQNPHLRHIGFSGTYANGVPNPAVMSGRLHQGRGGEFPMRHEALWHRFRAELDGPWSRALGITYNGTPGAKT